MSLSLRSKPLVAAVLAVAYVAIASSFGLAILHAHREALAQRSWTDMARTPGLAAPTAPRLSEAQRLRQLRDNSKADPVRFGEVFLGRVKERGYWTKQREVCRSVVQYPTTVVPAGNAVGKSYVASGIVLWFLYSHDASIVFSTAPSQTQLAGILWKEIRAAWKDAPIPLGGRIRANPEMLTLGDKWYAIGQATNKIERMSGHHSGQLLAVIDEASGVDDDIYEGVQSLKPTRKLMIGNPLAPKGRFWELCKKAEDGAPGLNLIRIPSTLSPHAHLERSPVGMADANFLEESRVEYGEGSLWWLAHILAQFPEEAFEQLIGRHWLDLAESIIWTPSGPSRLAIDLGGGNGGDNSVLLCRDDNGVRDLEHSRNWSFETVAMRAAEMARRNAVEPHRVSYDAGGIGHDFGERLRVAGLPNARGYLGGREGPKFANLRTASAWLLRRRLDPSNTAPAPGRRIISTQTPFSIRSEHMKYLREELLGLRYTHDASGRLCLEKKEEFVERLKRSPDFSDALIQSFAFPE